MPRLAARHTSICVVDLGVALCVQHMNVELDDQNRRVDAVGARAENTHDEIRRALRLCLHQLFEYGRKCVDSGQSVDLRAFSSACACLAPEY